MPLHQERSLADLKDFMKKGQRQAKTLPPFFRQPPAGILPGGGGGAGGYAAPPQSERDVGAGSLLQGESPSSSSSGQAPSPMDIYGQATAGAGGAPPSRTHAPPPGPAMAQQQAGLAQQQAGLGLPADLAEMRRRKNEAAKSASQFEASLQRQQRGMGIPERGQASAGMGRREPQYYSTAGGAMGMGMAATPGMAAQQQAPGMPPGSVVVAPEQQSIRGGATPTSPRAGRAGMPLGDRLRQARQMQGMGAGLPQQYAREREIAAARNPPPREDPYGAVARDEHTRGGQQHAAAAAAMAVQAAGSTKAQGMQPGHGAGYAGTPSHGAAVGCNPAEEEEMDAAMDAEFARVMKDMGWGCDEHEDEDGVDSLAMDLAPLTPEEIEEMKLARQGRIAKAAAASAAAATPNPAEEDDSDSDSDSESD